MPVDVNRFAIFGIQLNLFHVGAIHGDGRLNLASIRRHLVEGLSKGEGDFTRLEGGGRLHGVLVSMTADCDDRSEGVSGLSGDEADTQTCHDLVESRL